MCLGVYDHTTQENEMIKWGPKESQRYVSESEAVRYGHSNTSQVISMQNEFSGWPGISEVHGVSKMKMGGQRPGKQLGNSQTGQFVTNGEK